MTPQEKALLEQRDRQQAIAEFSEWIDSLPVLEPYQPRCGDCKHFHATHTQVYLATGYCTRNVSDQEGKETGRPLEKYNLACPEFEADSPF
jgi:hypothetical protein